MIKAPDKRWYVQNIFLTSLQKHKLWVLIRSPLWGTFNKYLQWQHWFLWRSKINQTFQLKKKTTTKKHELAHDKIYNEICATSEDSDQTALITCCLQPPGYPKWDKREPLPYWVDIQADLSLCWSHRSYCRSCALAQISVLFKLKKEITSSGAKDDVSKMRWNDKLCRSQVCFRPEVIKHFSCFIHQSIKFVLLINLKLLMIANSFLLNIVEHENFLC